MVPFFLAVNLQKAQPCFTGIVAVGGGGRELVRGEVECLSPNTTVG